MSQKGNLRLLANFVADNDFLNPFLNQHPETQVDWLRDFNSGFNNYNGL
jgi:hypothetical protein